MANDLVCPICGQPTRVYMGNARKDRLCGTHADMLKAGTIVLGEDGVYRDVKTRKALNAGAEVREEQKAPQRSAEAKQIFTSVVELVRLPSETGSCIVCEKKSETVQCTSCYEEGLNYRNGFDKNSQLYQITDYYFNLRSNIYRMQSFPAIQSNCNKLIALALLSYDLYKHTSLTDRIQKDIIDIIEKKKPYEEKKATPQEELDDAKKSDIHRTTDGHLVKSHPEVVIDDILYGIRAVHCYEMNVPVDSNEQAVNCDWFIPVLSNTEGIYIEYWGMKTKDYIANKKRKIETYKRHNLPLIEIEMEDYKDPHSLTFRLKQEIVRLKKEYFHISEN